MINRILFTLGALDKLRLEKQTLLYKRKIAVISLRTAREMGDLSENAAYKVARHTLSSIDSRLRHLDHLLKMGKEVAPPSDGTVGIGSKVTISDGKTEKTWEIVGSFEADPSKGKISSNSPLGGLLIGRSTSDRVILKLEHNENTLTILKVF